MTKRLLFVVNEPRSFVAFRLPVAIAAKRVGYEVHVASGPGPDIGKITDAGIEHHLLPLKRSGTNPFAELLLLFRLFQLFRKLSPDLVHNITIKPVIYGGIIARLAGVRAVVSAISGLGTVFLATGTVASIRRRLVIALYWISFGHSNMITIFQNPSDRELFIKSNIVSATSVCLIPGSGVDLSRFAYSSEPDGQVVVVFAARLLHDKGIMEYVEAARLLSARNYDADFQIAGDLDPENVTSITPTEMQEIMQTGLIRSLGFRDDMHKVLADANIVVLPSYREGLPRVLCEAAACGRAVITTDVPGCRDAIIADKTGLLVPVREAVGLADAIAALIDEPVKRRAMGKAGRELAKVKFSVDAIVATHIEIYTEVCAAGDQ